jgi:VWFA-related protein
MRNRIRLSLLFVCLGLAGSWNDAFGQIPSEAPEARSGGAVHFRVHVDLTTVQVMASDKKGEPVRNLAKEDFQLYEEGERREILSLDEVDAQAANSALGVNLTDESALSRGKTVLIVFDDTAIGSEYLQAARKAAAGFVRRNMRSHDVFAVAAFGMSMQILQNFTGEKEAVLKAVESPAGANAGGGPIYFENLLRELARIIPSLGRIRGQKTVLIYAQAALSTGGLSQLPQVSSMGIDDVIGRRSVAVQTARGSGTLESTYKDLLEAARRANVVFYTVDPGGLNSPDPSIALSLRSLATESGGYSILDTNALDSGLDGLDRQISNYYILGYQSAAKAQDGGYPKILVRTKLKGISLKYGAEVQEPRSARNPDGVKQEKALTNALVSPVELKRLPVRFRPLYFYDSKQMARVLVAARIQLTKAAFRKKKGQFGADLNIMGAAYAADGNVAARFSEILPVYFPREKEKEFRGKELAYRNYLRLRPGKYRLKIVVADEGGNLGSKEQTLDIPSWPEHGLAGSSITIAEQVSSLPALTRDLQSQLLSEDDPLIYAGMQMEPGVNNLVFRGGTVPVVFHVYNLRQASDPWNLTAKVRFMDEKGTEYQLDPIALKDKASVRSKTEAVVGFRLTLPQLPGGGYRLLIDVSDGSSAESVRLQTDIVLAETVTGGAARRRVELTAAAERSARTLPAKAKQWTSAAAIHSLL